MEIQENMLGASADANREEGELSEDGEIIELSDTEAPSGGTVTDSVSVTLPRPTRSSVVHPTPQQGDSSKKNVAAKRNNSPKKARNNTRQRGVHKPKPKPPARNRNSPQRSRPRNNVGRNVPPRRRSRSTSRERARFPGYVRDSLLERELDLPKSYQTGGNNKPPSKAQSTFWDRKRQLGFGSTKLRFYGNMNKKSIKAENRNENTPPAMVDLTKESITDFSSASNRPNTSTANSAPNVPTLESIAPLMSLVVDPPPPPPPLPPPLPPVPPPSQNEPPPPPTELPLELKLNLRRKANRNRRIVPPRSPPGEVDNDYIDLLLEYKQIQKQLESIKREEERAANYISNDGQMKKGPSEKEQEDSTKENDAKQGESRTDEEQFVPPWRKKHPVNNTQENAGSQPDTGEEEDLDELELRLAALASAAKRGSKLERSTPRDRAKRPSPKQNSSSQRKRGRESSWRRESTSSNSSLNKRRHMDEEPPWIRRVRQRKEDERRRDEERERQVEDERRREEQRRREVQKILTLDNPDEQVERFLRLCRGSSEEQTQRRPSLLPPYPSTPVSDYDDDDMADNYEVKEMDIDSDISSPAIVTANEDVAEDMMVAPGGMMENMPPMNFDPTYYNALQQHDPSFQSTLDPSDYFHPMEMPFLPPPIHPLAGVPLPDVPYSDDYAQTNISPPYPTSDPSIMPLMDLQIPDPQDEEEQHIPQPGYGSAEDLEEGDMIQEPLPFPPQIEEPEVEEDNGLSQERDEADALRALLLKDMKKKSVRGLDEESKSSRGSSPLTIPTRVKKAPPKQLKIPIPPRHSPVVISLGGSSDSDDSDDERSRRSNSKPDFLSSIDQFLKDARQASDKKADPPRTQKTPEALKNLPQDKLTEYKLLKQEIRWREQQKNLNGQTSKLSKASPKDKPETATDSENGQKTTSLKVSPQGDKRKVHQSQAAASTGVPAKVIVTISNVEKPAVKKPVPVKPAVVTKPVAVVKPAVEKPTVEKFINTEFVKQLEAKLAGERLTLEEDESVLLALRGQVTKRKQILKTAEIKAQKLQEQLQAAERIVTANRQQIQRYVKQGRAVKATVDKKCKVVESLEKQVLDAGQHVFGESYSLQLTSILKRSPLMKTKPPQFTEAAQTQIQMNMLAEEKKRLLELEKLYGDRIRKLKESQKENVGVQNPKQSNVAALMAGSIDEEIKRLQHPEQPEKIITTEKMSFTNMADSDLDKEIVTVTPRRRRSLLDLQSNTNSLIPQLKGAQSSTSEKGSSDSSSPARIDENPSSQNQLNNKATVIKTEPVDEAKPDIKSNIKVKVENLSVESENGQVLTNLSYSQIRKLQNLQASNLMKFPTSGLTQVMSQDPSLSPAWWPKQRQSNSRKLDASAAVSVKQSSADQSTLPTKGLQLYSSPLLAFRSYRFNPYFRMKEKQSLPSQTYAHQLDVRKVLCKYELHGTCNDEKCPWQHKANYELSKIGQLQDIASYCPTIAGVSTETAKKDIPNYIGEYAEKFSETNKCLSHEEQILLLAWAVDEKLCTVPPHHVRQEAREWRPIKTDRNMNQHSVPEERDQTLLPVKPEKMQALEDNIIMDGDVRYWLLSGSELEDMETTVMDSPNDVHMWLKLAYKKLTEGSEKKGLDKALNVFAHALQANKGSEELWLHYLSLYSRRADNSDLMVLCEQAVKYAASYRIYWKYLGFVSGFDQKDSVCKRIRAWLCEQEAVDNEVRSHQLLEVSLYQASLFVATGRLKMGVQVLKSLITSTEGTDDGLCWQCMTALDKVVLMLAHIHLTEFRNLPPTLFDPTNGLESPIVSKEVGEFAWREGKGSKIPIATLDSMFRDAERQLCKANLTSSEFNRCALPLYTNWLHLLTCSKKLESGKKLCRRVLKTRPTMTKLWLILARLEAKSDSVEAARQVLQDGLEAQPCCTEVYYSAAQLEMSQDNPDGALELLEEAVICLYEVDQSNSRQCDPNLLYCHALKQPISLSYTAPPFKPNTTPEVQRHKPGRHLWLSYCLLLDLQGDHHQVKEVYEAAVATVTDTHDLQAMWTSYLRYVHSQAMSCSAAEQQVMTARLCDLVHRCLVSSPVRFPMPHRPGMTCLDYRFHNEMIDILISSVPRDQVAAIYERFIMMMPSNVQLICRACEEALRLGDRALARGITTIALMDQPGCLQLWKTHLRLAQWNSTYSEVKKTFQRAVQHHPLVQHIWKDYLLYEIVHGSMASAKSLIAQCHKLSVHITDYITSLVGSDT